MLLLAFLVGVCIGVLGTSYLRDTVQKKVDKEHLEEIELKNNTIDTLSNKISSYEDIVKSLNKEIKILQNKSCITNTKDSNES